MHTQPAGELAACAQSNRLSRHIEATESQVASQLVGTSAEDASMVLQ